MDIRRIRSALATAAGLAAVAAPAPLVGQATPAVAPPAPAGQITYETFTLPNGLRVIYSEDHSTPVVTVDVWYNTGSRNERPGRSGFAHLFEHMMFQGSAHVKKAEHFQLVQRAGGNLNGSTTEDRTNYWEVLPSNRLNLALWLEADRMRSLAITDSTFHNQREAVKEERRLRVDNQPYARAFSDGLTAPFDSASCFAYAHTVIGSMADLDAAKREDVQAFFDTYYAPNNATLVVVGDFHPAELRRLINLYYAAIPTHPAPAAVSCDWKIGSAPVRREVTDEHANLPAALRLYRIPPHDNPDTPALELLNIILGQGESSRLNVATVRRDKAAVGAQAVMVGDRRGPGVSVVLGIANQGVDVNHLDTLLAAQVDSIRAGSVTPEELTKAKNTFRAGFITGRETTLAKAEEIHHYDLFHHSLADMNTDLDRYLAVTADDIRRVAAKYLDPANVLVIIVKPAAAAGGAQ
jgi:zinc protease